jgi:hypothetical protein
MAGLIDVDPMITVGTPSTPSFVPAAASTIGTMGATPPSDGFFDTTATYIGAVAPGDADPWYAGWTRFPDP